MSFDLIMNEATTIQIVKGSILFPEYGALLDQAHAVAEHLIGVDVTEETVKESKKLLAKVNKTVEALEDRRINVKNMMLEPYNEFAEQIKEIVNIVKIANDTVKEQVKELEELERDEKRDKLKTIFDKRVVHYGFNSIFTFHDFIKPQHLNKSVTVKKVEEEMTTWMERIKQDLEVINTLEDPESVLIEYVTCQGLATSISRVESRKELKRRAEQVKKRDKENSLGGYYLKVYSQKDLKMIEMFCNENDIRVERAVMG